MKSIFALLVVSLLMAAPAWADDRVGVVHAMQVINQMPQFQKDSQEYAADRARMPHLKGKERSAMQATVNKWQSVRSKFVSDTMHKLQTAATKVAKEKNLSMVLIDAPWTGATLGQDGAVDVTTDVIFALHGQ